MIPHLAIVGGAVTITTGIFICAYLLGKLYARVEALEKEYRKHLEALHK